LPRHAREAVSAATCGLLTPEIAAPPSDPALKRRRTNGVSPSFQRSRGPWRAYSAWAANRLFPFDAVAVVTTAVRPRTFRRASTAGASSTRRDTHRRIIHWIIHPCAHGVRDYPIGRVRRQEGLDGFRIRHSGIESRIGKV
jgi:hypothetical protein